jgi:phosphoadenosine phosphosulfate reductase
MSNQFAYLKQETVHLDWQQKLHYIATKFADLAVFSTSFSIEDQVITQYVAEHKLPIRIFTLDTGRLFSETYKVWQETIEKYGVKIEAFYPQTEVIEKFVGKNGINSFYGSHDLRLECCHIRKVEPLSRALHGAKIWLSGLRKEQSLERAEHEFFEEDVKHDLIKFYPVLDLTRDEILQIIKEKQIPYNKLHDQGFASIGCAPCTRAIAEGEDERAGRWWWESEYAKECGLHMVDGKLVRKV